MNIIDILICPECKSQLAEDLKCKTCKINYSFKDGVYNILPIAYEKKSFENAGFKNINITVTAKVNLPESPFKNEEDEKIRKTLMEKNPDFREVFVYYFYAVQAEK